MLSLPLTTAESFIEETSMVQLQLLTATVKLFLKQPETSQVGLSLTKLRFWDTFLCLF